MDYIEFEEKWTNSTIQELNEWVALDVMGWEKTVNGWRVARAIHDPHLIYSAPPQFISDNGVTQILDEICINYDFLVWRHAKGIRYHAQIGYNLSDPQKAKILYESEEKFFSLAVCKVSLMCRLMIS